MIGEQHNRPSISPPPRSSKRVRRTSDDSGAGTDNVKPTQASRTTETSIDGSHHEKLTIYAWNVNGITPFLQSRITSFFSYQTPFKERRRSSSSTDASNSASNIDDNSSTRENKSPPPHRRPTSPPPNPNLNFSLRAVLKRHAWPQIVCLQEVKIHPNDRNTIRAVERAATRSLEEEPAHDAPEYTARFCLPKFDRRKGGLAFGGKVYGVCTFVRTDFYERYVERVREVDWDAEGRVLVLETREQAVDALLPRMAVVNVYAVNGTDRPWRDSDTGVVLGTRHDRKLAFHRCLQAEVRELEARGFAVVLAGDLNVARAAIDGFPNLRTFPAQHCVNRADFNFRFFGRGSSAEVRDGCDDDDDDGGGGKEASGPSHNRSSEDMPLDMVDTFRHLYPEKRGYTYYPRTVTFGNSCDRVDMIIASKALRTNLRDAGMHETPAERGPSDHVPLFAVFSF